MEEFLATLWQLVLSTLIEFWGVLAEMSPWLIFGFLVAGILSVVIPTSFVKRHMAGRGFWPVAKASILGVPLPLCSCGVIPVGISLRKQGASRGAAVSFLISTPQTGVDSIAVTYSLLGPVFAVYRPIVALLTGIGGGCLGALLKYGDETADPAGDQGEVNSCSDGCGDSAADEAGRAEVRRSLGATTLTALRYGFVSLPKDIAKPLVLGLIIAGLISALVPAQSLHSYLGGGIWAMLLIVLVSVPMYVCATASVPIGAAMIAAGASPGVAFAFLMAGPATNAATLTTIARALGKRTAGVYLGVVATGAIASGLLLDVVYSTTGSSVPLHSHAMFPAWFEQASAVALILLLTYALLPKSKAPQQISRQDSDPQQQLTILSVKGMDCSHCSNSVEQALLGVPGVSHVAVNLGSARAEVAGKAYDDAALIAAIEGLGYQAESATP